MASSGTYNFSLSNGEAVLAALERCQVRAPSIRQEHMVTARREINLLLAEAANKQVNLWKVVQVSTDLAGGTATYDVTPQTVMILDAWITTNAGSSTANDRYITPFSRTDYASLSNKSTQGAPTVYWFDRLIAPTVTLWPVPDASSTYQFNYFSCVQMFDANLTGGETPDLPYLWLDWLVAGLAHRLSRVYAPQLEQLRKADAMEAWQVAATQGVENVPIYLTPGIGGYYRR